MTLGAVIIIIIVAIVLIFTFYIIGLYTNLVDSKSKALDKFKPIEEQLKKKASLIPDLVDVIDKYAKHEDRILNEATKVYGDSLKDEGTNNMIKTAEKFEMIFNNLFVLEDVYPKIKEDRNFNEYQKKAMEIDNKINYAKSFYNAKAFDYNELILKFPFNVVAKFLGFKELCYFDDNGKDIKK